MVELVKTQVTYMETLGQWTYIVERVFNSGGRSWRNSWARHPATSAVAGLTPSCASITAAEVPKDVRRAAGRHFEQFPALPVNDGTVVR